MKNKGLKIFFALLLLAALLICGYGRVRNRLFPPEYEDGTLSVWFINVGQGDCTLIRADDKFTLIDAGPPEYADFIVGVLERLGVRKLEYCIATHPHSDHIGGMENVLNAFGARVFMTPAEAAASAEVYENMMRAAERRCDAVVDMKTGMSFESGGALFTVLWPPDGETNEDLNEISAVVRVDFDGVGMLFCADIGEDTERRLMDRGLAPAQILKLAHHGSGQSSCRDFILKVSPEVAVASCAIGNEFGHPAKRVVAVLDEISCELFVTGRNGTVCVTVKEGKYQVSRER